MKEKYIFFDDEEIIYHVYNLNWHLPKRIQNKAFQILLGIPYEKTPLLIPKYAKECWENSVKIISTIGYPSNEKVLPKLATLIEDTNWPGSKEAIDVFKEIGPEISIKYIEPECKKALISDDDSWRIFLFQACEGIGIKNEHFEDQSLFLRLKKETENM